MRFYNRLLQTNIRCNKGLTLISFAILEGDFVPPTLFGFGSEVQRASNECFPGFENFVSAHHFYLAFPAKFSQPENPSFVSAFTVLKQCNLPKSLSVLAYGRPPPPQCKHNKWMLLHKMVIANM